MNNQTNLAVTVEQSSNTGFPKNLLSKSPEERLNYFKNFTIAHPNLAETFDKLWRAILDPQPGSTVMIYGPAGVGKTKLCGYLEKRIRERFAELLEFDREMIPLVKVEASNPVSGNFDWKHLFREILLELCEPATDQKLDLSKWKSSFTDYQKVANNPLSACQVLRDSVEVALRHRKPKGVLIDEAQHMCVMASGRRLVNQPDSIKSVANRTQTTHVLFGSYELMSFRDLNGQLARRTVNVHFRRYVNTSINDFKDFESIIWNFQQQLPLDEPADLIPLTKYLYEGCFGCIGILKDWLCKALSKSFSSPEKVLTKTYLDQTKLDDVKLLKIAQECVFGERKLETEKTEAKTKLHDLLGYSRIVNGNNVIKNKTKGMRSPGIRKPCRDVVGIKISA